MRSLAANQPSTQASGIRGEGRRRTGEESDQAPTPRKSSSWAVALLPDFLSLLVLSRSPGARRFEALPVGLAATVLHPAEELLDEGLGLGFDCAPGHGREGGREGGRERERERYVSCFHPLCFCWCWLFKRTLGRAPTPPLRQEVR